MVAAAQANAPNQNLNSAMITAPGLAYAAITPSNSTNLVQTCRAIYVGTTGDIAAVGTDGTVVTFVGVPQGIILPIVAIRINSTNTTASNLVALF